jgi:hypothetical protein
MAVAGATWLGVVWSSVMYLRPLIMHPLVLPVGSPLNKADGWTVNSWVQDAAGHRFDAKSSQFADLLRRAQSDGVGSDTPWRTWMANHHYSQWDAYQPASRFWHFQAVEAGAYAVLALLLAAATTWWVRRRAA